MRWDKRSGSFMYKDESFIFDRLFAKVPDWVVGFIIIPLTAYAGWVMWVVLFGE